ncbi:hypothetical protein [Acidithiobacillus ferridurans]|uniref:Uncharacterized protein n=2 Tax=Acidithiobacillus ferridurans TaxID=1232575 RepID=A0A2Z6IMM2_ACIFI|nr:hypothetical protein [Acidithiobacillus ferridurans]MBU2716741.1 hypothetical protein [Acidithiobacillus ferridurans]MBU2724776.1 hypothetical protein [Acidithiobacillus ferridurans]MBU2727653.1 hypothetical protein [Acidithiobacillus ferridurans]BBF66806.1 hypothetical protein AFERRID_30240 [Acidithiobacillus ferridurans]
MLLKTKIYAVTLISLVALAGCANKGPESGHTAKWYEAHTSAQTAEIIWCGKQPLATKQRSKSCRAANAASKGRMQEAHAISDAFTSSQRFVSAARAAAQAGQTTQTSEMDKTGIGGCASIKLTPDSIGPDTSAIATIVLNSQQCSPRIQDEVDKIINREHFGGIGTGGAAFHIASSHGDAALSVTQAGALVL